MVTSKSEWTPTHGLVVSGEMTILDSPSYVHFQAALPAVTAVNTTLAGLTVDGRKVLLDINGLGQITGIEVV